MSKVLPNLIFCFYSHLLEDDDKNYDVNAVESEDENEQSNAEVELVHVEKDDVMKRKICVKRGLNKRVKNRKGLNKKALEKKVLNKKPKQEVTKKTVRFEDVTQRLLPKRNCRRNVCYDEEDEDL